MLYKSSSSFLFVNATKIYQFKASDSKIKKHLLCLGNLSKDFRAIDIEKARLSGYVYEFSIDYVIDPSYFIYIHKYLMKNYYMK